MLFTNCTFSHFILNEDFELLAFKFQTHFFLLWKIWKTIFHLFIMVFVIVFNKMLFICCCFCCLALQAIELAFDAIRGHKSAHSLATGPVIAEPFISPLLLTITPALSSKYKNIPSRLLKGFRWRITTAGITYKLNTLKSQHKSHAHWFSRHCSNEYWKIPLIFMKKLR